MRVPGTGIDLRPGLSGAAPLLLIALVVLVALWPIGLGGRMPVGGDVTQFSIGLMAEYKRALAERRLPLWNARWGFGFPGLAESQMGVYYPPHVLLYSLLPTEEAYTANLVFHYIWAAWGAAWLARRLGASRLASAFGALVWVFGGFFTIHLPHPWAYTAGSWLPWTLGLGWTMVSGQATRRTGTLLAGALAAQVFAGHFQLAFITQVALIVMGLALVVTSPCAARQATLHRAAGIVAALAAGGVLAFAQLWPTWQLAKQADADRTVAYLSDFATSPLHLVSYVAPALFHASPLWRSLVWDPFHTSPEEHLGYIGLLPLWLALATGWRLRRQPAVRAMAILAVVTLFLSLGPYVPGFPWLARLPGFSFFRAPARWGLATMLALAMLAALGLDRLRSSAAELRGFGRFLAVAVIVPALVVGGVELALASRQAAWIAPVFETVGRALPWQGDPTFRQVIESTHHPSTNPIVVTSLMRRDEDPAARFDRARHSIYGEELRGTVLVLLGSVFLLVLARWRWPRPALVLIFGVTTFDLGLLTRLRPVETAPLKPLVEQSSVLKLLADLSIGQGARTIDTLGNLTMIAGTSPVVAYRTLDVPALPGLQIVLRDSALQRAAGVRGEAFMAAVGARVRVFDPLGFTPSDLEPFRLQSRRYRELDDVALASWLYGPRWVARNGRAARTFRVVEPSTPNLTRAWHVSADGLSAALGADGRVLVEQLPGVVARLQGLAMHSAVPEALSVGEVVSTAPGESVLITQLYDPEWRAEWRAADRSVRPATIQPVFQTNGRGGWQSIATPGPGRWALRLWYEGAAAKTGLAVAAFAWPVWIVVVLWSWPRRARPGNQETSTQ